MSGTYNSYLPMKARIEEIIQETFSEDLDIKTYRIKLEDNKVMDFLPGQFVEFSIPGVGECPFGFASNPLQKEYFDITIKRTGKVTDYIHALDVGSTVWIRGPFGSTFPLELMEKSSLLFIAGGLGLAPLRPFITYVLDEKNRAKYDKIDMLLAARTSKDHCFSYDYADWRAIPKTTVSQTIDRDEPGWDGFVGFPNNLVKDMPLDFSNLYAIICGPPIMIKSVASALTEMGLPLDRLYTTLENRMTCGVGKCGRCNVGCKHVCLDGPVFCMTELAEMPDEY